MGEAGAILGADVHRANELQLFDLLYGKSFAEQLFVHVEIWGSRNSKNPGDGPTYLGVNHFCRELAQLNAPGTKTSSARGPNSSRGARDHMRSRYRAWRKGARPKTHWPSICRVLFGDNSSWLPFYYMLLHAWRELEGHLQDETSRGVDLEFDKHMASVRTWLAANNYEGDELAPLDCHRVREPHGPDLYGVYKLHDQLFGGNPEIADSYDDLVRWMIEDNETDPEEFDRCHDITITLKRAGKTVAYLMAQSYPALGFVYIGYVGVNEDAISNFTALPRLLEALREEVEKRDPDWHALVGEMQVEMFSPRAGRDQSKYTAFALRALRFARNTYPNARFFSLGVNYRQPLLRPQQLGTEAENSPHLDQHLVLFAHDITRWPAKTPADGALHLTTAQVDDLFGGLFGRWYAETYPDHKDYQRHLRERLAETMKRIGTNGIPTEMIWYSQRAQLETRS